jgi:hypothetical protein
MVDKWFRDAFSAPLLRTIRWFAAPATILNPLIDAVEQAIRRRRRRPFNTSDCRDRAARPHLRQVETDEGVLGDQVIAIVPVEILCV